MKKEILFGVIFLTIGGGVFAQNTFPDTGNAGIGTLSPTHTLEINGDAQIGSTVITNSNAPFPNSSVLFSLPGFNNMFGVDGLWTSKYFGMKTDGNFVVIDGNVGIGITTPAEKLAVNGNIRAKEVKVETTNWPDYVFEENYRLMSLTDLESYIKNNGHLPGIPTAQVIEKEGIALSEIIKAQQKIIEELTLHLIEKDKKLNTVIFDIEKIKEHSNKTSAVNDKRVKEAVNDKRVKELEELVFKLIKKSK